MGLALSAHTRESQEENTQETLVRIGDFDFQSTDARGNPQITISNVQGNLHRMEEGDDHETWGVFLIAQIFQSVLGQGNRRQSLNLNNLTVEALADQVNLSEDTSRVSLPLFRVEANRGQWSRQGLVRGPIQLEQRPNHQVSIQWDRLGGSLNLDVEDLAARINVQGIAVTQQMSQTIRNFLDPSIHSLGVDGGLEANFTAQFPDDLANTQARGLVLLHGDRRGDVYWLDRRGRRTGPPIIRDTRWRWTAVNRINLDRGYALGRFHLDTLINLGALMQFSQLDENPESAPTFYGRGGRRLNPWEINGVMPYDNQPATPQGFINRIVDYLETMHRQFLQSGGGSTPTNRPEGGEDS